jgi:hypothetical protein
MLDTQIQVSRVSLTVIALAFLLAAIASNARADVAIPPPGMSEAEFEALVAAEIAVDMASLLPPGTRVISNYCYHDSVFGCLGRVSVRIDYAAPPGHGSQSIDVGLPTTSLPVGLTLDDISVTGDVEGTPGRPVHCSIDLTGGTSTVDSDITLAEIEGSSDIDATQLGTVTVGVGGFDDSTDCDGDLGFIAFTLAGLFVDEVETRLTSALQASMDTVDGEGNTPIAAALENAYPVQAVPALSPMGLGALVALLFIAPIFFVRRVCRTTNVG